MSAMETMTKVLKIKAHRVDELEIEAGAIAAALRRMEAKLASLSGVFAETAARYDEMNRGAPTTADELGLFFDYFGRLGEEMGKQKREIIAGRDALEMKRKSLADAYGEKKLFERLMDKMMRADARKREVAGQKEMDFLSIVKSSGRG